MKRNAFLDGLQSGVFVFVPRGVSQSAACDGHIYTVNNSNAQPGTQTILLTLFEEKKHHKIQLKENAGQNPTYFTEYSTPTYINLRIFMYLDTYFILLECRFHTVSKSTINNRESSLNEFLQNLTNAQILYWNLIGQNILIQAKVYQVVALLASGQKLLTKT